MIRKPTTTSRRNALDSLLNNAGRKQVTGKQAQLILDSLAGARDARLVARFPAALAICLQRGIKLNSHELYGRYWQSSPKRQNLEKLMMASARLFRKNGLELPRPLHRMAEVLTIKHGDLFDRDAIRLDGGISVSIAAMERELRRYLAGRPKREGQAPEPMIQWTDDLESLLGRLFSPKQRQLVHKRLTRSAMTKTEREYYSRVVKKKLQAIACRDVQAIATRLAGKPGGAVELPQRR
jgi:hypothetical protein